MSKGDARLIAITLCVPYLLVPLFPVFITLTGVDFPGVSVVPKPAAFALLACIAVALIVGLPALFRNLGKASPIWWPSFAWFAAALLSVLLGFNPRDGLFFCLLFASGLAWQAGVWRGYMEPGIPTTIFGAWIISGTLAAGAAVAMVLLRIPADQYTIAHGRAVGTFVLPGELAGYLILFVPVAFAVARVAAATWLRLFATAGCIVGVAALAMTFSRAGWIGFGTALAVFLGLNARTNIQRLLLGGVVLAAAFAVVLLTFDVHHNPSENYTRLTIWQAALQIINRYPLTGVGPFGFSRAYALARLPDGDAVAFHAHSVYLTVLAELGIVGFCAFLWTLWTVGVNAVRRLSAAAPVPRLLAVALVAGLAGTLVQGVIDVISVIIFGLWLPTFALALAAAGPSSEELARAR